MSRATNDLKLPMPHRLSDSRLLAAGLLPNHFQKVRPPGTKGRRSATEYEERQLGVLANELSHQPGSPAKYSVANHRAVNMWLTFAFECDAEHEKTPSVSLKTATIFVNYFWKMWTSAATVDKMTPRDAVVYLKRQRLDYGYQTLIEDDDVVMVDSEDSDNASASEDAPKSPFLSPSGHDSASIIPKVEDLPSSPLSFNVPTGTPRKRKRSSLKEAEKTPKPPLPTPAASAKKPKVEPTEVGIRARVKKRKRVTALPDLEGKPAKRVKVKTALTPITPSRTRRAKINVPVSSAKTAVESTSPIAQAPICDVVSAEQVMSPLTPTPPTPPGLVEHAPCGKDVPPGDDVMLPIETEPTSSSSHQTEPQCGVSDLTPATDLPASESSPALIQCCNTTVVPAGDASTTNIVDSLLEDVNAEQKPDLHASQSVLPDISAYTLCSSSRILMALKSDCEPPADRPKYEHLPPIWAMSRQEVCEAYPRFQSYQGGVYHNKNVVKGYFLSKFSALRDGWFQNGRIIISHGGGKAESVSHAKGHTTRRAANDQEENDHSVSALLNTYRTKEPLVLLIDEGYRHFPFDLKQSNFPYVVLGFYFISHVWTEYQPASNTQGYVVRYKFAFQWCANQDEPWWIKPFETIPQDVTLPSESWPTKKKAKRKTSKRVTEIKRDDGSLVFTSPDVCRRCAVCGKESPQVYSLAWMCLQSTCSQFWRCTLGDPLPTQLVYNPKFLELSAEPVRVPSTMSIFPPLPVREHKEGDEYVATHYIFSRGWHCKKCGRLSCRYRWLRWECANSNCNNTFSVPIKIQSRQEVHKTTGLSRDNFVVASSGIKNEGVRVFMAESWIHTWVLPHAGRIHRIRAKSLAEADTIFALYQRNAKDGSLDFRRWPMRRHMCKGQLLTHYFSHNCGVPYHYVGGTENTVPWDKAPEAVAQARDLIHLRLKKALPDYGDYHFNEVLSAAYMEDQSMAFHSDAEDGLDRIVAGLSMGSPAKMQFRSVKKFLAPNQKQETLLTIVLEHGDVLVMEGAGIQERYEHKVIPEGFRIAATARKIDIPTLKVKAEVHTQVL
ncbi:hypothetical protein BDZ89DRAFT_1134444 [Hymenopellis radicata]|nr:hypothetical protein BDZ89DRAFT_1134444 [Hymenopellis radicata]